MRRFIRLLLPGAIAFVSVAAAADWQGRPLAELLQAMNAEGYQIIFSSDVVSDDLLVESEPNLEDPLQSLRQQLAAHGLQLGKGPGSAWLVQRAAAPEPAVAAAVAPAEIPLPEVIVTSSLHRLDYREPGTHTYLDRELATRIPAAAEEAVRITTRLPGTASGGISSRSHIRGGEANEVLFLFDGLRLYEPYHLKDFQSVATIVNSNAIDGIDFYSGAYPARYGDRMSGVMSMRLREPQQAVETELALSFFNTSLASLGTFANDRGDWLVAARRGNLDLIADVVDPEVGNPDYHDYLLHAGWEFGPRAQLSANLLASFDKLTLIDNDRGEYADAVYENQVLWLKWVADWSGSLHSETILSASNISDSRDGTLELPFIVSGTLRDRREFDAVGLKQDWQWLASKNWMLGFGFEGKHQDASYEFDSTKTVSPPFDAILDNMPIEIRAIEQQPEGAQYGVWLEARWQLHPDVVLDAGLRWDSQSYTDAVDDSQFSPRLALLYQPGDNTELRLGWGRYWQAQEINELQVNDGIERFFPAQQAEHVVANLEHGFGESISVNVSLYSKRFHDLRPRFSNAFNQLTLLPEIQFDRYRIEPTSAEAHGAELLVSSGDGGEHLFWWLGYAWAEVRDRTATGKLARAWDQTHTVKFGFSWRWSDWDFSAAGEVHTGWPKTELLNGTVTDINAGRYSVFHTLDARVSRQFDTKRGELTVFAEITNLYDRDNPCCTEYSMSADGTELIARQGNWLPLVPSLGIVWRF